MDLQVVQLFNGESDPRIHIEQSATQSQATGIPSHFWIQVFPHSIGPIPKSWFIHGETKRQNNDWQTMETHFCKEFSFKSKYLELEVALQKIKQFLFTDNGNHKSNLVVCAKYSQGLQTNIHFPSTKTPIECYLIRKD
jgi:hypothetical protein